MLHSMRGINPRKNWRDQQLIYSFEIIFLLLIDEESTKIIYPMAVGKGKEPIGSMGDTARLAVLSNEPRSFFDSFQNFLQVTNPPRDYLREKIVTDLTVYLGKNQIFLNLNSL